MITASIVAFHQSYKEISKVLDCVLASSISIVYIIDNSSNDALRILENISDRVRYIHNANIGFGGAHNIAIREAIEKEATYHVVVNPDIYFEKDTIESLVLYMEKHMDVGMMMPRVLNMDGSCQYLPKLLPSPFDLLLRKLKRPIGVYKCFIEKYELRNISSEKNCNVPIISGCFSLLNMKCIKEIGGYDERFFMYFEDFDLSRRIHKKYKTIYFPSVSVYHGYEGGANKNFKLFKIFVKSAIKYFNKWGWIFDRERREMNRQVLVELDIN